MQNTENTENTMRVGLFMYAGIFHLQIYTTRDSEVMLLARGTLSRYALGNADLRDEAILGELGEYFVAGAAHGFLSR